MLLKGFCVFRQEVQGVRESFKDVLAVGPNVIDKHLTHDLELHYELYSNIFK